MVPIVFYLVLSVEVSLLLIVLQQSFKRRVSIWPPRGEKTKSIYALMVIFYLILGSSIWICFQEWGNPFIDLQWLRYLGAFIISLGLLLYTWCRLYMSKKVEFGGKDHLITHGPYQFTRNPLYIADAFIFVGFALFSNSILVIILMVLLVLTLLLLPLIEEPWLLEQYGEQYRSYKAEVPRYIKI